MNKIFLIIFEILFPSFEVNYLIESKNFDCLKKLKEILEENKIAFEESDGKLNISKINLKKIFPQYGSSLASIEAIQKTSEKLELSVRFLTERNRAYFLGIILGVVMFSGFCIKIDLECFYLFLLLWVIVVNLMFWAGVVPTHKKWFFREFESLVGK